MNTGVNRCWICKSRDFEAKCAQSLMV